MMVSEIKDKVGSGSVLGLTNLTIKNPFIKSGKGATPIGIRSERYQDKEPYDPCDSLTLKSTAQIPDDRDFIVAIWDIIWRRKS